MSIAEDPDYYELLNKYHNLLVAHATLQGQVDCAINALTDSIGCCGNDEATNMHWVLKLKQMLKASGYT